MSASLTYLGRVFGLLPEQKEGEKRGKGLIFSTHLWFDYFQSATSCYMVDMLKLNLYLNLNMFKKNI